jgi:RNA polymerase sigma-70 factor (ECF subfamily)
MDEHLTHSTDSTLMRRFQDGDQDAALQLYLRYADRLVDLTTRNTSHALSSRIDPEDIVQSVFRTFFRRAASGQYDAPEGDELWKLFLVIALNKVRSQASYHKAAKRDVQRTQSFDSIVEPEQKENHREFAKTILRLSMDELIESQPPQTQVMIRLRIEGYQVQEIANKLKRSKRTVERVLQGFRDQMLQSVLDDHSRDSK